MFQILVVENDKELRDLFCTVLTDNVYMAVPATDGLAAFDILDNTNQQRRQRRDIYCYPSPNAAHERI